MRNRSLIALSAVGIHLSIGSVYAFSVLVRPIMETLGASMGDVTWTFSLAILFLGMSAALLGRFVEKIGPQKSGEIAEERTDIKVGKINVDEQGELAQQFGVMSIPTLVVMKNGQIANKAVGAMPKANILALL